MQGMQRTSWFALTLLGASCGDPPPPTMDDSGGATTQADSTGESAPAAAQECASRTFVGRLDGATTCADHGPWHGITLGSTGLLAEFCEYTWRGVDEPDLTTLPDDSGGVVGLSESCPRVVPQADPFSSNLALRASIQDAFLTTVGKISLAKLVGGLSDPPSMYIVDTIPDSLIRAGLTPNDGHGLSLHTLAEQLLCGETEACPVSFMHTLALPKITPEREDRARGGAFGSLVDLARGIDEAVRDWELSGSHSRLILTLAVGWEPLGAYGPDLVGKTLDQLLAPGGATVDAQAVIAALMRAACQDAAIVAAVGNTSGAPCTQADAVGPAMLQSLPSPTVKQCEAAGFPHAAVIDQKAAFLLSATHVDLDGRPLGNARGAPAGVKAQGAAFGTLTGDEGMLTGSSVAALVSASAISAVWAIYPELSRVDVLASLQSDAASGVNICRSVVNACGRPGAEACIALVCPEEDGTATAEVNTAIQDALAGAPNSLQLGADYPGSMPLGDNACGTATTSWIPTAPLPPPEPPTGWTMPQPKKPFCPTCITKLQDKPQQLTVGLSLAAAPTVLYPILIEVQTAHGVELYPLDPTQLIAGINSVTILPAFPWYNIQQIRLVYPVQDLDGRWVMRTEPLLRDFPTCGNGRLDDDEACDDGNSIDTDACSAMCADAYCGDGLIRAGVEACDDGNLDDGDSCTNECALPSCGDGLVQIEEACDDANTDDADACLKTCLSASCGDGHIQTGVESCDDGNLSNSDACADCEVAKCGDGFVRQGVEACDDGNTDGDDDCTNSCALPSCGDGLIQIGEQCDDGNLANDDICLNTCLHASCGDGYLQPGESCDDGNAVDGGPMDFCLNNCEAFDPATCQAPEEYVECDENLDLYNKNDETQVYKSMGICDLSPDTSVQLTDWSFDVPDEASWQVAKGFGSYLVDHDMNPDTSMQPLYSPREGSSFLLLSTGRISAPDPKTGIVTESPGSQFINDENKNPDAPNALPLPMTPNDGSNNGLGGTPFFACDGKNDCSGSLEPQWKAGNNNPDDQLFFSMTAKAPLGTRSYTFDFVFCSAEWPDKVNGIENDMLIAWQVDPTQDDPNQNPPIDAYTGSLIFASDEDSNVVPVTITSLAPCLESGFYEDSPELSGTGFDGHFCSNWSTVVGNVEPGSEVTIAFFLADMGDSSQATMVIFDNFRWGCDKFTRTPICSVPLGQ